MRVLVRDQFYEMLSDGKPHDRRELWQFCKPSSLGAVRCTMSELRKVIPPDEDILCVLVNRKICYQLVRRLASANNGRR